MARKRYANALVNNPSIEFEKWMDVARARYEGAVPKDRLHRVAKTNLQKMDVNQYLLSHATIVASVDTYSPKNVKLGRQFNRGVQIDVKFPDFRTKVSTEKFINNNGDAWSRPLLLSTYRTFVGAHVFVEHIQIPELSKGFIVDAIARDLGETVYIDILTATDRKHTILINDILNESLNAFSMGCVSAFTICNKCGNLAVDDASTCFPPNSQVLKDDGIYRNINELVVGDQIITHTGSSETVINTMSRHYVGDLVSLDVEGIPNKLRSTPDHPVWILRPSQKCGCGCGELLRKTIEHRRGSVKSFQRRFLPGHNDRIVNPNPNSNVKRIEEFTSSFDDLAFSFVEAKEIVPGDYAAFPIPTRTIKSIDATVEKARLIGYFLAEGCYIKRNGKRVGVTFSFGFHEHETLSLETESLLNSQFSRSDRKLKRNWKDLVAESHILPVKRNKFSRPVPEDAECPSCSAPSIYARNVVRAKDPDNCLKCKVCNRNWIHGIDHPIIARRLLVPRGTNNSGISTVTFMDTSTAEFFYKYCGEYSNEKRLHPDIIAWPSNIQKHVLFSWLNGDGNHEKTSVSGNTTSYFIQSQMHLIAARCDYYSRRYVTFNNRSVEAKNVVNGDSSVTARDERGWLPMFKLTIPEPVGFTGETRFIDKENLSVKMKGFFDGFKRVGNYLVYKVKSKNFEPYHGDVFNLEVSNDSSYVVEGLAVHNCPCVLYDGKGSKFLDEEGVEHTLCELIGHASLPDSNQFIESSWVKNPAFKGAVNRKILNQDLFGEMNLASQIQNANNIYEIRRDDEIPIGMWSQVASTRRTALEPDPDAVDAGDDSPEDKDLPEPKAEKPDEKPAGSSMDKLLDQAQEKLLQILVDKLAERLTPKPEDVGSVNSPRSAPIDLESGNDNLQHSSELETNFNRRLKIKFNDSPALVRWAQGAWKTAHNPNKRASLSPRSLIVLSWVEDRINGKDFRPDLYKAAITAGNINNYPSEKSYLASCKTKIFRPINGSEEAFLIRKGRIASLSRISKF